MNKEQNSLIVFICIISIILLGAISLLIPVKESKGIENAQEIEEIGETNE